MPRRARMYIPGLPYHVVQRGNNREPCFIEPENYLFTHLVFPSILIASDIFFRKTS